MLRLWYQQDRTDRDVGAFSTRSSRASRESSRVRLRRVTIQRLTCPFRSMPLTMSVAACGGGAKLTIARLGGCVVVWYLYR